MSNPDINNPGEREHLLSSVKLKEGRSKGGRFIGIGPLNDNAELGVFIDEMGTIIDYTNFGFEENPNNDDYWKKVEEVYKTHFPDGNYDVKK